MLSSAAGEQTPPKAVQPALQQEAAHPIIPRPGSSLGAPVDLDEDGYVDLAIASKDDNTIAWFKNNGNAVSKMI